MFRQFPDRIQSPTPNRGHEKDERKTRWRLQGRAGLLAALFVVLVHAAGCGGLYVPKTSASSSTAPPSTPSITNLVPLTGTPGTAVVIDGSGFGSSQTAASGTVTFNNTPAPVISWSSTQIVAEVPQGGSSGNVVVTADALASGGSAFTVTAGSQGSCQTNEVHQAEFSGTYAYEMSGFAGSGQVGTHFVRAGSITISAGNITGGEEDLNTGGGDIHHTINPYNATTTVPSTLMVEPDNRGCMTLNYSDGTFATFRFSIGTFAGTNGVALRGHIIEFDDATGSGMRASGILIQQVPGSFSGSELQANYAFGLEGIDSSGGHVTDVGTFTLAPTAVPSTNNISNGFMDVNDAGNLLFPSSTGGATTGTLTTEPNGIIDTSGRTTAQIVADSTCGATCTYNFALYIIDVNEAFLVSSDALSADTPLVAGQAIATATSFTTSTLAGEQVSSSLGFLLYGSGSSASIAQTELGQMSLNSTGNTFTSTLLTYTSGTSGSSSPSGTFSVSPQGRLTFSGSNLIGYLTTNPAQADNTAAFISDTSTAALGGLLLVHESAVVNPSGSPQPSPAGFSFGTIQMADATVINESGVVGVQVANGGSNDTVGGAADQSSEAGLATSIFTNLPFTFSATGQITGATDGNGHTVVGWADGTGLLFIDETGPAALVIGQQ